MLMGAKCNSYQIFVLHIVYARILINPVSSYAGRYAEAAIDTGFPLTSGRKTTIEYRKAGLQTTC